MFTLRIHSVDTNNLLTISTSQQINSSTFINPNPKIQESRGIVHLYRKIFSTHPSPNVNSQESTILFIVAVPSYISSDDFRLFCGSYIEHVLEVLLIRNDAMEDRYCVLIKFVDQRRANDFYRNFNGRRFSFTEAEICHILFTASVEFTELAEIASTAPSEFTELPNCPVCLERLDQDTSGILTTLCDHSFQCPCISKWTDSSCLVCRFCQQLAEKPTCSVCGTLEHLWICVICGFIGCGRYKEGHAVQHWKDTQHCYSLNLDTQQVWSYVGDTYVHRLNPSKTDGKSAEIYRSSLDGECGTCECSEDYTTNGPVFTSEVDKVVDDYNNLLANQLENNRQYKERLLVEAKSKKETCVSEAAENALNLQLQEIEVATKNTLVATNAVRQMNERMLKEQDTWRKKLEEIEEREMLTVKLKEEQIMEMQEQIRDLTVYVRAQKTLSKMTDSDSIKGGTVLPVPLHQSSTSVNTKRRSKTGRRRT